MSIVNNWVQNNTTGVNSTNNIYKGKNFKMILPSEVEGKADRVNSNTMFIAEYHGAYGSEQSYNNHINGIEASYGDSNNHVWFSPASQHNDNPYFVGENNVPDALGIPPENTLFVGSSYGGQFMMRDFERSITEHPDTMHRKCVFFEPTPRNKNALKEPMSDEQINNIKKNGATIFLVDGGDPANRGDFTKNIETQRLTTPDSDARVFHVNMNFTGRSSRIDKHHLSLEAGISKDFGFIDLLSGDPSQFEENIQRLNNGETLTYTEKNRNYTYSPIFELYYKGKKITFDSAEDFYRYYQAVENINVEKDPLKRLEFLKTIYDVEHTGEAVTDLVRNVASLVNSSMNDFNACINRIEKINTICTLSNPLGLTGIIEETATAYNNTVDSFKTFMGEFTSLGIDASSRYESLDEDLDNSAGNIN